jgi:hypothetical protein
MTTAAEREALIEAATGAHRERLAGRIVADASWHDLDEEGRKEAFDATMKLRVLESALDREGLSTTARAVLAKIRPA